METLDSLINNWDQIEKDPTFKPFAYYNKAGDAIEAFSSDEPRVSERINSLFSVFVSEADRSRVVGLVIKNISKHFGKGPLMFIVNPGRARIEVLVRGVQLSEAFSLSLREPGAEKSKLVEEALSNLRDIEVELTELQATS